MKFETRRTTQKDMIRKVLVEGGKVSPLSALRDFGCMRLADVIFKLRAEGLDIVTTTREQKGKRYAVYKLAETESAEPVSRRQSA